MCPVLSGDLDNMVTLQGKAGPKGEPGLPGRGDPGLPVSTALRQGSDHPLDCVFALKWEI